MLICRKVRCAFFVGKGLMEAQNSQPKLAMDVVPKMFPYQN